MKPILVSALPSPAGSLWDRTTAAFVAGLADAELLDPAVYALVLYLVSDFGLRALALGKVEHLVTVRLPPLSLPIVMACPPVCDELDGECAACQDPAECYLSAPERGFCPFLFGAN